MNATRLQSGPLFSTMDRYLLVQVISTILFGIILFTIIWLAPDTLFKLVQFVSNGDISVLDALVMFLYHIPGALPQSIPIAVLLGSFFVFQRLSQQFELIAMFASGISRKRVLSAVVWAGLFFAIFHGVMQEVVIPKTSHRLKNLYVEHKLKDQTDQNFVFVEKTQDDDLDRFFLIGQAQNQELRDFVILYFKPALVRGTQISRIIRAASGKWDEGTNQWELYDGIEYILNEEGVYQRIRPFAIQQARTDPFAQELLKYNRKDPMSMNWLDLSEYISMLKSGGQMQDVPFFEMRLWQKAAVPLASLVFVILGALFAIERVRSNKNYGLTYAAGIVFLYSILNPFATNLGTVNVLPPWIVAWVPLVIVILISWAILKLSEPESSKT